MEKDIIKVGFDKNRNQKYYDKVNKKWFILNPKYRKRVSQDIKDKAIKLYLDGCSIRAVARCFDISHVSVLKWIKKAALACESNNEPTVYHSVQLDEMWHFIKKKSKNSGSGWLLIRIPTDQSDFTLELGKAVLSDSSTMNN
jgi:transposase-like protein